MVAMLGVNQDLGERNMKQPNGNTVDPCQVIPLNAKNSVVLQFGTTKNY
jgi:hypothetical protein